MIFISVLCIVILFNTTTGTGYRTTTTMLEFEFQMDDVSEDIYVEGEFTDTITEEHVLNVLHFVRNQEWFSEGNKTEGIVTFSKGSTEVMWNKVFMVITNSGDVFDEVEGPETYTIDRQFFKL